jgi:sorting nexin-29
VVIFSFILDGEGSIKQNLQERLHDAVKQCQTHFGGRQEVATEGDIRVNTLCIEWETVLCHGFKKPKTSRLLSFGKSDTMTGVALWPLLRHFLSNEEQERFLRLRHVSSDIGRGRAWLRASINERTLENYLHTILADVAFLRYMFACCCLLNKCCLGHVMSNLASY